MQSCCTVSTATGAAHATSNAHIIVRILQVVTVTEAAIDGTQPVLSPEQMLVALSAHLGVVAGSGQDALPHAEAADEAEAAVQAATATAARGTEEREATGVVEESALYRCTRLATRVALALPPATGLGAPLTVAEAHRRLLATRLFDTHRRMHMQTRRTQAVTEQSHGASSALWLKVFAGCGTAGRNWCERCAYTNMVPRAPRTSPPQAVSQCRTTRRTLTSQLEQTEGGTHLSLPVFFAATLALSFPPDPPKKVRKQIASHHDEPAPRF